MGTYEIVAEVPNRLRLRLRQGAAMAGALEEVAETLRRCDGVRAVRTSSMTNSIVVERVAGAGEARALLDVLEEKGYTRTRTGSGHRGRQRDRPAASPAGSAGDAERLLRHFEHPRLTAPAALGVLAGRQLLRHGLQLHKAPWHTFAWYAYNLYRSRGAGSSA